MYEETNIKDYIILKKIKTLILFFTMAILASLPYIAIVYELLDNKKYTWYFVLCAPIFFILLANSFKDKKD